MMKSILFTGGGSAGHVTPNIALIPRFTASGWQCYYAGSAGGIEESLIAPLHIPYYAITTGKLRRYFSWENFLTPFCVLQGIFQGWHLCHRLKPTVVFSKGGFVAFPVVVGAWLCGIPVIAHESDLTPGLANRMSYFFSRKICLTFSQSVDFFKSHGKLLVTGTPLRPELSQGQAKRGLAQLGFNTEKPILLITGGGLGAGPINLAVRAALPSLLTQFQIIHLCGKGKTDPEYNALPGYQQFEYVTDALPDFYACTDLVVSRAGANALYELLALRKPHLLIPLSKRSSRGDQILNAAFFEAQGLSQVLPEENLSPETLQDAVRTLWARHADYTARLRAFSLPDSVNMIYQCCEEAINISPL